jgi:glycosyltransferase involved in cell wall biosynthesis
VLLDGLAFGAMPEVVHAHAGRLNLLALVHHPLAEETGLEPAQARRLRDSERRALAVARHVIVTSMATRDALAAYGVTGGRISVVEPGTDRPAQVRLTREAGTPLELLCVAALVPRKGHATLFEALARLLDRDWRLACVGSAARDPATATALERQVAMLGLQTRVRFTGELAGQALWARYAAADLFVLATLHEGYGMVLAEALAFGLPIVSTTAGAVPDTVPRDAGMLVPPGNAESMSRAIARMLDDASLRARHAAAARRAAQALPTWHDASTRFARVLEHCADT